MKRWQDRGEVQDSDDEDLSLSNDSQSPEQVRKRPRLDDDLSQAQAEPISELGILPVVKDYEPDESWLRPQATTTYGRKTTTAKLAINEIVSGDLPSPTDESAGLSPETLQPEASEGGGAKPLNGTAQSSDEDELPNLSQLFRRVTERPLTPPKRSLSEDHSTLSSPLSELEVSPPAVLLSPRIVINAREADVETHSIVGDETLAVQRHTETGTPVLGRSLRTRTEKQLHPFQYDKTLYQQQWRQRGLRPVHYSVADKRSNETQDDTYSTDESETHQEVHPIDQSLVRSRSQSLAHTDPERGMLHDNGSSADRFLGVDWEFPDIETIHHGRLQDGVQDGRKRRKTSHLAGINYSKSKDMTILKERQILDNLSIPPSPPPTSSDSIAKPTTKTGPAIFRMPYGTTPAHLHTPQVSSDARPKQRDGASDYDTDSLPLPRSRPSMVSRRPPAPVVIDLPTDSSDESESQPEVQPDFNDRRLRKERKRIRGVLPASWLKIDLKAQQRPVLPSPSRDRDSRVSSPSQSSPSHSPPVTQRGVARRFNGGGFRTPGVRETIFIDDDNVGDQHDSSPRISHSPLLRQSHLDVSTSNMSFGRLEAFDIDERMEVDYVDPMLASTSMRSNGQAPKGKRQLKITHAFETVSDGAGRTREDRLTDRNMGMSERQVRPPAQKKNRKKRTRPSPPLLSIVDAPSLDGTRMPQFVRLARRQARRRDDLGRHTLARKQIRLATNDETEEASAALLAWREGTIAPRLTTPFPILQQQPEQAIRSTPLEASNHAQRRSPASVPTEGFLESNKRPSHSRPRLRQTRLNPERNLALSNVDDPEARSSPTTRSAGQLHGQARKSRLQPRGVQCRGAQLETLAKDFDEEHRAFAFERRVRILTENVSRRQQSGPVNESLQLDRFVHDVPTTASPHADLLPKPTHRESGSIKEIRHRPRKRRAAYVDAEAERYRQPSEPLLVDNQSIDTPSNNDHDVLTGLATYGARYTTDFDIQPLRLDTSFHESTSFISGGGFAKSLQLCNRDLNNFVGEMRVHVNGEVLLWGAWTEEVAEGIAQIPGAIRAALQSLRASPANIHKEAEVVKRNVDHMLHSVVRYCGSCLAFLDPVDRRSCVQHLQNFVGAMLELLAEACADHALLTSCLQYALVIATQANLLARCPTVESGLLGGCESLHRDAAHKLARHVLPSGFQELREFYELQKHDSNSSKGFRHDDTTVSALVSLRHCLADDLTIPTKFWSVVNEVLENYESQPSTVQDLDRVWCNLFTTLPVLEIDVSGLARPGSRFIHTPQDWTTPKLLLNRLLRSCASSGSVRRSTINGYVRATFIRCHRLISRWGWWRCEGILGMIFDFYARRNLAPLPNEDLRGSSRFLEELAAQPNYEVEPGDRSFHIFLKLLATGLLGMRKHAAYTERKIGSIAWRFIPNHGRTYRKDVELEQTDLDALRNHFDLLSTLYYVSPPQYRLRVDLLRGLVDHGTSHREACRLSVRAWTNLTSFHTASSEPVAALTPFVNWFKEMMQATITQYRLAETEAKHDFAVAKAQGAIGITDSLLNSTVATNQRAIANTLVELLVGLKRALLASKTVSAAIVILEGSVFWKTFDPFDMSERRLYGVLTESLEVVNAAFALHRKFRYDQGSQSTNEDSQEFGDSTALQVFASTLQPEDTTTTIPEILYEPLGRLMSNVFGADQAIEDTMVATMVDVWAQAADVSVLAGKRTWNAYLDDYDSSAWHQLPDSNLKRKFTPYFLACVVEKAARDDLGELSASILRSWMTSLMEREASLKYQHLLTERLLNCWPRKRLLWYLPFARDLRTSQFVVSMHDFRSKRLSLISSILSNIRDDYDSTLRYEPMKLSGLRQTYADMLRWVMQALKSNYQSLQAPSHTVTAKSDTQGAYVNFVHQVVSFMQQYTADICRIDPFFTDSSAFPLPAADPTYVVGRLRSYVTKLAESRTRKQLAVFVHTVSERAVVDGHQQYLVDQLCVAMAGTVEHGRSETPTLRHVLLSAVLPIYIEGALSTACSWIMGLPFIEACGEIVGTLLYNIEMESHSSISATLGCIGAVVAAMLQVCEQVSVYPGLLGLPHVQRVLSAIFEAAQSTLTVSDYLCRSCPMARPVWRRVQQFYAYAQHIGSRLEGQEVGMIDVEALVEDTASSRPWTDTELFARKQATDAFERDWHAHDAQYFVRRGNGSVEVVVQLEDEEAGRDALKSALEGFSQSYESMLGVRRRSRYSSAASARIEDDEDMIMV